MGTDAKASIYSLMGSRVYTGKLTSGINEIDLDVSDGTYIVKVQQGNKITTRKVFLN